MPAEAKKALNGYIIQSICVYKISKSSYFDFTPIFMKNSYSNAGKDDFVLEGNYLHMVKENKMPLHLFQNLIYSLTGEELEIKELQHA